MIQVETTVISDNCTAWRDRLREHREKLNDCQHQLQQLAARELTTDQLRDLEQLHNQFHVQLVNIHDLKHSIKTHLKKTDFEFNVKNGHLNDDTLAEHEVLLTRYSGLEERLQELQDRFTRFVKKVR
ncbi:MAG: hypothetical protein EOO09_06980 [Chitinophagaceae bacterium]|nr:MAG: hypothetical protein EOO09_06980 [Chitinophagaceae bacterium]